MCASAAADHQAEPQHQLVARVGEAAPGELLDLLHPVDHRVAVAVELLGGVLGRAVVAQQGVQGLEQGVCACGSGWARSGPMVSAISSGAICGLPASSTSGSRSVTDTTVRSPRGTVSAARVASWKAWRSRRSRRGDAATPTRPVACGVNSSTSPASSRQGSGEQAEVDTGADVPERR